MKTDFPGSKITENMNISLPRDVSPQDKTSVKAPELPTIGEDNVRPKGIDICKPLRSLSGHKGRVFDIGFHPAAPILASGSEDDEVHLTDLVSGNLLASLQHESEVLRVSWAHDSGSASTYLASATSTGKICIRRVEDPMAQGCPRPTVNALSTLAHRQGSQVYCCKYLESHNELMTAADDKVFIWDVQSESVVTELKFSEERACGERVGPGEMTFVFDACIGSLGCSQSPLICVALSDGCLRLHDRRSTNTVATMQRSVSHLTSLALGSVSNTLVACCGAGEATVYDGRTLGVRTILRGPKKPLYGAAFVPSQLIEGSKAEDWLATWSAEGTFNMYDLRRGGETEYILPTQTLAPEPLFPIYAAAFSHAGDRLVLAGGRSPGQGEDHGGEECEGEAECKEVESAAGLRTLLCHDL